MPPNSLRDPIQKCLSNSFNIIASIKNKDINNLEYIVSNTKVAKKKEVRKKSEEVGKNSEEVGKIPEEAEKNSESTKYMFIKQLEMIKECLECEKIHDANRTLLSQIVENYFSAISDDNVVSSHWKLALIIKSNIITNLVDLTKQNIPIILFKNNKLAMH